MSYKLKDTFAEEGFYVTQVYGNNPAYYSQFNLLWHEGIDFGHTDKDHAIKAVHGGVIIQDYDDPTGRNYGNTIVVWDDKQLCATYYCHLSKNIVKYGDRVTAGQVLGYMGSTGNSTGPHCHFNFVQTDSNGVRKYNAKQYNWGYLDPQYPRDPNPPKFPSGMNHYQIEWYTGNHTQEPDIDMSEQDKKDIESMRQLREYRGTWYEDQDVIRDYEALQKENTALSKTISGKDSAITTAQRERDEAVVRATNAEQQLSRVQDQLLICENEKSRLSTSNKQLVEMNDKQGRLVGELQVVRQELETANRELQKNAVQSLSALDLLRLALLKFLRLG